MQVLSGTHQFPTRIVDMQAMGDRVYASDLQESIFYVRYKPSSPFHHFLVFAEDNGPKWITCVCVLDYDTVAVADKFGSIFLVRIRFCSFYFAYSSYSIDCVFL